ncbi:M48 family metallopeptidase [Geomonas sp. Red69]|uniref:M48 family metallopeptidase n=1 Tax=Geomonas diazotrophica TaxID=2843197 RepID=A0ABX8JJW7_9BACT|nr:MULTISPECIES: M48 family metallopeptidase [Geomonas]MBU5635741.1 M48 family metallopeptidase [Geomonas diazotrophica]QWV98023.1 M48 family metallopeptidase [Geomonas nitrogeniifigens]QXE87154.1 M48 family metallopeptidase [Geomonas nitrogeniifigens]
MSTTTLLIALYLTRFAAACLLRYLNLRHLRRCGCTVPQGFEDAVDAEALAKSASYTLAQSRLALVDSVYDSALLIIFMFTPLLPLYDHWIASLTDSFVLRGVLFMLVLTLVQEVLDIPFSLYSTFRLERRYGFNTTTPGLWISDFLKSTLVSAALTAIVISAALLLVRHSPALWWLWVWAFFAIFSIVMIYVSPYLIEPLFSKFEPLGDPDLEEEIRGMLQKADLRVKDVQQMDASRRSLHSNAYFTGIGRVKRIVLYDTLLKQMERPEVLAILAHEAGHWKKGHIWKRLALMEASALALFYLVHQVIAWGGLPQLFGLPEASFLAQILMVSFIFSIVSFPLTPVGAWLSRRNEWEADRFAASLSGTPEALASALVKLSKENLANLHPHPFYAAFYYSHPPVVDRVAVLRSMKVEQTSG